MLEQVLNLTREREHYSLLDAQRFAVLRPAHESRPTNISIAREARVGSVGMLL